MLINLVLTRLGLTTELESVSTHSEIVPDTVIFDDFERSNFFSFSFFFPTHFLLKFMHPFQLETEID